MRIIGGEWRPAAGRRPRIATAASTVEEIPPPARISPAADRQAIQAMVTSSKENALRGVALEGH